MVRKVQPEEYEILSNIWLEASIKAHNFVPREFWEDNRIAMRDEYLPASETWVIEDSDEIAGFMSLVGETVAALFVSSGKQRGGLGSRLLQHAQREHENLTLCVYKENESSVAFYKNQGFKVVEKRDDEHTGCAELVMCWTGCTDGSL